MENNNEQIDEILEEVHHSHEIEKCRHSKVLLCEGHFVMTKSEAYEGLYHAGVIKTEVKRSLLYTVLILLAIVGFLFAYTIKRNFNNIIFVVISLIVLGMVWIVLKKEISSLAKLNVNGKKIEFQIYETHLSISDGENRYCIHLDNSSRMKVCKHIIVIKRIKDNRVFVIPMQSIERSKREEVLHLFQSGMITLKN